MRKLEEILESLQEFEKKAREIEEKTDLEGALCEISDYSDFQRSIEVLLGIRNTTVLIISRIGHIRDAAIERRINLERFLEEELVRERN